MEGHRVGCMEPVFFDDDYVKDEEILALRRKGRALPYIADRLGCSESHVHRVVRKRGLIKRDDAHRTTKLKCIKNVASALEYVDEVRIFRGPDTETGEPTYCVSLEDEDIIGLTCGTVTGALNSAMRMLKEPADG